MGPKEIYKNLVNGVLGAGRGTLLITAGIGGLSQAGGELAAKAVEYVNKLVGGQKNVLTMYGKNTCIYCKQAKKWLKTHGIKFTYINVDKHKDAFDFLRHRGHTSVPQFYVGDKIAVEGGYLGLSLKYQNNSGALKRKVNALTLKGGAGREDEEEIENAQIIPNNIILERVNQFLNLKPQSEFFSENSLIRLYIPWEDVYDIISGLPMTNTAQFLFMKIGYENFKVDFSNGFVYKEDNSPPIKLSNASNRELESWTRTWMRIFKGLP
jgi:glutaredoxin